MDGEDSANVRMRSALGSIPSTIFSAKITVRQAVIDLGFVDGENLTEEELDKRLNVLAMANTDRDK